MTTKPPDPVFVLRGAKNPVNSVNFIQLKSQDTDIRYLSAGNQDGQVSIWDLKVRCLNYQWKAHKSSVLWVKYMDSSNLWTCGRNEKTALWDINNGSPVLKKTFPLDNYLGFSQCDIYSFEGQELLCIPGPSQESISVWDVHSGVRVSRLCPQNCKISGTVMQCKWVIFDRNLYLLVAYENGSIILWDWSNDKILSSLNLNDNAISLEFDSVQNLGICGTVSDKIFAFTINLQDLSLSLTKEYLITNPGIGCVKSRLDGKIYATGGWDFRIRLFKMKNHKPLAVLNYHKKSIECLDFSICSVDSFDPGFILAAGSSDGSISMWNVFN